MAMHSPFSSTSSSFTYAFSYDVFLSFRGTDTRFGFTGNLFKALSKKGIHTFIDDEELKGGDEITPTLIKAIQESRIAIPIFSVNYASSSFCLDELVTIIERVWAKGRLVLPVFYDVDPSHVRHQRGTYGEALAKHEKKFKDNMEMLKDNMERLQKWEVALNQAANLSGLHFKPRNEYEHEFIGKILDQVSNRLSRIPLHVADYPVGLDSRVLEVTSLLDVGSDGVQMVGIYGIGGMGKSTLARAVYNFIADQFEGLCFLHNVRENSAKYGFEHLQENLLSKTVALDIKLGGVSEGITVIKQRLNRKKVLLILDDVDKLEQLCSLIGEPTWFGSGSRVIIITRDKHLLASHGIEKKYEVHGLKKKEALELCGWYTFKNNKIDPCYENVFNQAVTYASGLPLALEVIGSNMRGKSMEEWKHAMERYERIPNKRIQKILEVSFYAIEEEEQSVFLDLACCFKGFRLVEVQGILCAHYGVGMKHHIGVLIEKSLIKITPQGKVTLHDLIEDMGKEIVRQESPKDPGKRSRLWSHKDTIEVLEDNKGTNKIEMIYLDFPLLEEVEWDGKAFEKMKNLRTLIIKRVHFSKGPKHLPNSLRVLEWWKYSSEHFPCDFHPKNLSICKLPDNCFTSLGLLNLPKVFVNIKVLNFDECKYLTHIHDISSISNLEELSFRRCDNLITIHNSVGLLNKLKILDASHCRKLSSFPPLKLPSLKQLELSYCPSLESFPEILEKMDDLTELDLKGNYVRKFPSSFRSLTRLEMLTVELLPVVRMPPLAELLTMDDDLLEIKAEDEEKVSSALLSSNKFVALVLPYFDNLKELDLSHSYIISVPESIRQSRYLWKLKMDFCTELQQIKATPPSLKYLSAEVCNSLDFLSRCMLLKQELHEPGDTYLCFPSLETKKVPQWFEHQSRGPSASLSFWFRNNFPHNLLLCLACPYWDCDTHGYHVGIIINGEDFTHKDGTHVMPVYSNHTYLCNVEELLEYELCLYEAHPETTWYHVEVVVENDFKTRKQVMVEFGIHVLKDKSRMDDIRFTNPDCEDFVYSESSLSSTGSDVEENERDESSD